MDNGINTKDEEEAFYDAQFLDDNGNFSGEKFARYLEKEGTKFTYKNDFPPRGQLPPYYDEAKFKAGQEVFQKFKTSLLAVKLVGLLVLLVHTTGLKLIMMTKRSNEPCTAFIRYRDTLRHVLIWYTSDFSENSKLWSSIYRVRQMHHAANLQASVIPDMRQITQFELAGTILGFIGFAIIKPNSFGMNAITDEELEALVYFWRVIGYLLGIQERFSVCRKSLDETKQALRGLVAVHTSHYMKMKTAESIHMQVTAVRGINKILFPVDPEATLNFAYELTIEDLEERSALEFPLNKYQRVIDFIMRRLMASLRFKYFRCIINFVVGFMVKIRLNL